MPSFVGYPGAPGQSAIFHQSVGNGRGVIPPGSVASFCSWTGGVASLNHRLPHCSPYRDKENSSKLLFPTQNSVTALPDGVKNNQFRTGNVDPIQSSTFDADQKVNGVGCHGSGYLEYMAELNREHLTRHPGELDLEARIASYELAARMQSAAKEAP